MNECLTVNDIMTREVVTISMDETLRVARKIFHQRGFHHLVVLEHGKPVGVVSDRDLLRNLSPFIGQSFTEREQDVATLRKRIHQVMSRQLVAVPPHWPAAETARIMIEQRVSCLPVIADDDQLVGIVTLRDVVRWTADALKGSPRSTVSTGDPATTAH